MDHSWGYGTDQRLREENQDCHGVFELPEYTLAVVCDGMGGHVGGAQASAMAVRTIHDTMLEMQGRPIAQALEQAVDRTNLAIYEAARKNHRLMGMGTTAVIAAITEDACYLAHVGDSRAYLIRNGQVQQLTRDHTMVNLFVDAELLSPEDAATHPEAHVLSRSLGVERQVDVELASPIKLEQGDVVFLCSDGVHGVVTDWELANVEWGAPHAGVSHVLSIVATREGDDNATASAVLLGTSFEDVPATAVPQPRRFDDLAPPSGGVTAVPAEDGSSASNTIGHSLTGAEAAPPPPPPPPPGSMAPPTPYQQPEQPPMADSGYMSYDAQEPPPQPAIHQMPPQPQLPPPPVSAPPQPPQATPGPLPHVPPQPPSHTGEPPRTRRRRGLAAAIPILAASFMLLVAVAGALVILLSPDAEAPLDSNPPVRPTIDDRQPQPQPTTARSDPTRAPDPRTEIPDPQPVPAAPLDQKIFDASDLPNPPRRIPHHSQVYNQPPPGGQLQYIAVNASRQQACPEALDAVQRGMAEVSIDHAVLYKGAWLCFNEAHQRQLEQTVSETWEEFRLKLIHFEGKPEEQERQVRDNRALVGIPEWYHPAVGGLEYRIEKFTADEEMEEVINDLFGPAKVADHLFNDLYMEGKAAVGLSRAEERTPALVKAWSRRVYVLATALRQRPGRLLDDHRKADVRLIRDMLDQATTPYPGADGRMRDVPAEVLRARRVGDGDEPPPRRFIPKVDNRKRLEDYIRKTLGDDAVRDDGIIIDDHKGRRK